MTLNLIAGWINFGIKIQEKFFDLIGVCESHN